MKIHGLCLVKNESDVVEEILRKAAVWCDSIYVLDNGSTDDTWEIVQQLSRELPVIIPHRQTFEPFSNSLRSQLFNHYHTQARQGDWWCRLDADEIYSVNPKDFLNNVPTYHHVVWGLQHQFYFTEKDLADYKNHPKTWSERPIEERMQYYLCNYSEIRFFRHRSRLQWNQTEQSWPRHLGLAYPERIPIKHYQFRSPEQIKSRLNIRQHVLNEGFSHYENLKSWQETIRQSSDLRRHVPGTPLDSSPEIFTSPHMDPMPRRILKFLLHQTGIFP